jgi:hypothetical protein
MTFEVGEKEVFFEAIIRTNKNVEPYEGRYINEI